MATNLKKTCVLQKCLRITFYSAYPWTPIIFLKTQSLYPTVYFCFFISSCLANSILSKDGTSMTRAQICKRLRSPGINFIYIWAGLVAVKYTPPLKVVVAQAGNCTGRHRFNWSKAVPCYKMLPFIIFPACPPKGGSQKPVEPRVLEFIPGTPCNSYRT
jgi:hypothetical protein